MGAKTSTLGIGIFVACDLSTVTDALLPAVYLIIHWDGDCVRATADDLVEI